MNTDLVIFAPLPAMRKRTRLAKMGKFFSNNGIKARFFGWEREKGELQNWRWPEAEIVESTLLYGGGYASGRARLMYPLWMILVFFKVIRLRRGTTCWCLGWETAFPARLAATISGAQIIFDDADRFSMILKLPGPAQKWLESLERWTSRSVDLHVIPSFSRYEWRHERMIELANAPLREDMLAALASKPQRPPGGLVLYANGWIGETRGAPIFLRLLEKATEQGMDLRLVIAGHVTGDSAHALIEHPFTHFIGEVSQQEALSWYSSSDILLTYYDPAVTINRKAESNKWGDAIFFHTPFIVNTEVETAQTFVEAGAAWSVPYSDVDALLKLLAELASNPDRIKVAGGNLGQFETKFPIFDDRLTQILETAEKGRRSHGKTETDFA